MGRSGSAALPTEPGVGTVTVMTVAPASRTLASTARSTASQDS